MDGMHPPKKFKFDSFIGCRAKI